MRDQSTTGQIQCRFSGIYIWIDNGHLIRISDTQVSVIRDIQERIYLLQTENIRIHEKIETAAAMLVQPGVQMIGQFCKAVTVQ